MRFCLVDRVLEQTPTRIVTLKHVSNAEEYLQDHFPTFPVLPGVLMLEAMVQAGRLLADAEAPRGVDPSRVPFVLGSVRALKYAAFVPPGASLRVEVDLHKAHRHDNHAIHTLDFRGTCTRIEPDGSVGPVSCSGRFELRRARVVSHAPRTERASEADVHAGFAGPSL